MSPLGLGTVEITGPFDTTVGNEIHPMRFKIHSWHVRDEAESIN
jgi:hypothetical protein